MKSSEAYRLKFTNIAYRDLDQIYAYIKNNLYAPQAANELTAKIEASILHLKDFPLSCNLVSDEILRNKGYRKLVVENYLALYLVKEQEKIAVIMRIFYGAQNYQKLL